MNRNYKNIIICITALLMMLPTVMGASAEPSIAPAGGGGADSGSAPSAVTANSDGLNKMDNTGKIIEACRGCSEDILRTAVDAMAKTNPDNYMGYDDYNYFMDRKPWKEPPDGDRDTVTLPVEDNLIANPPEYYIPVDPVIEPPQEYPGNDAGLCVIGTPSPCNAPEYWWPNRWNWDHWSHYKYRTPILIVPEPPIITLPVEPYELADANCYGGECGFVEPGEPSPGVRVSVEPVEPEEIPSAVCSGGVCGYASTEPDVQLPVESVQEPEVSSPEEPAEAQIMPAIVEADDPSSDSCIGYPGVIEPPHPPCESEGPCYT